MSDRKQNFQTIAWFRDLAKREALDLDPPYQRRSVWTQRYREEFIDTILLDYPAPAIFLFQEIDEDGTTRFSVVDGKQRLTTVLDFVENRFSVSSTSVIEKLRGKYFKELDGEVKVAFWEYQFPVEYLPTNDEAIIGTVFDRLNRNVAKLTPQELRHAKYNGEFIQAAETLADFMLQELPNDFPRLAVTSRRQMKDVELVSTILLLLEEGPKGYSTSALDEAFSVREEDWPKRAEIERRFRKAIEMLKRLLATPDGEPLVQSRYRNQADFYSLVGAVDSLMTDGKLPDNLNELARRLSRFAQKVEDHNAWEAEPRAFRYYDAARSASNDAGPRSTRVAIIKEVLLDVPVQR